MKILIIYESRFGLVKKAVDLLSDKLIDVPDIKNSKEANKVDLTKYDNILIGGSILMGKIQKRIKEFINKKMNILMTKKIVLFIAAAATDPEEIKKEINNAFPQKLRECALYIAHVGYGFNFEKMNFFYRTIIKKSMNTDKSIIELNLEELDKIATIING